MAKQPEQILEEQLVAQLQRLGYGLASYSFIKSLNFNIFKNFNLKMVPKTKKDITFASTVPALHTVRSASGSFFFI